MFFSGLLPTLGSHNWAAKPSMITAPLHPEGDEWWQRSPVVEGISRTLSFGHFITFCVVEPERQEKNPYSGPHPESPGAAVRIGNTVSGLGNLPPSLLCAIYLFLFKLAPFFFLYHHS